MLDKAGPYSHVKEFGSFPKEGRASQGLKQEWGCTEIVLESGSLEMGRPVLERLHNPLCDILCDQGPK